MLERLILLVDPLFAAILPGIFSTCRVRVVPAESVELCLIDLIFVCVKSQVVARENLLE